MHWLTPKVILCNHRHQVIEKINFSFLAPSIIKWDVLSYLRLFNYLWPRPWPLRVIHGQCQGYQSNKSGIVSHMPVLHTKGLSLSNIEIYCSKTYWHLTSTGVISAPIDPKTFTYWEFTMGNLVTKFEIWNSYLQWLLRYDAFRKKWPLTSTGVINAPIDPKS